MTQIQLIWLRYLLALVLWFFVSLNVFVSLTVAPVARRGLDAPAAEGAGCELPPTLEVEEAMIWLQKFSFLVSSRSANCLSLPRPNSMSSSQNRGSCYISISSAHILGQTSLLTSINYEVLLA